MTGDYDRGLYYRGSHWLHDHLDVTRRVALFVVGIILVLDSTVFERDINFMELGLGLLVLGVIPVDIIGKVIGQ